MATGDDTTTDAREYGRRYADQQRDLDDHAEPLSATATLGWDAVRAYEEEYEGEDGSAAKRGAEERWAEIVEGQTRLAAVLS